MEEYKKVTGEKDEIKRKLDDAEKRAKEAFDEAAGLKKERDEKKAAQPKSSKRREPKEEKRTEKKQKHSLHELIYRRQDADGRFA